MACLSFIIKSPTAKTDILEKYFKILQEKCFPWPARFEKALSKVLLLDSSLFELYTVI